MDVKSTEVRDGQRFTVTTLADSAKSARRKRKQAPAHQWLIGDGPIAEIVAAAQAKELAIARRSGVPEKRG